MTQTNERKRELASPTPRINLHNTASIRRELANVYRDMRNGKIEAQDGTRLAYVLNLLRQAYEAETINGNDEIPKPVTSISYVMQDARKPEIK